MISQTCQLARYLEIKIITSREFELLAPVHLNIVCFRYRGEDANRLNAAIVADLHEAGIAAPSTTTIGQKLAIRAAIFNHRTQPPGYRCIARCGGQVWRPGPCNPGGHNHQSCTHEFPCPPIEAFELGHDLPVPIGLPTLAKLAFDGFDLAPTWNALVDRVTDAPDDAAAILDLSTIAMLQDRREDRIVLQFEALKTWRLFRQPPARATAAPLRLLAFMATGDFMANIPIEFLLANWNVQLDMFVPSYRVCRCPIQFQFTMWRLWRWPNPTKISLCFANSRMSCAPGLLPS